jgi:hypothetical protein
LRRWSIWKKSKLKRRLIGRREERRRPYQRALIRITMTIMFLRRDRKTKLEVATG